jgi:hypothetical protein
MHAIPGLPRIDTFASIQHAIDLVQKQTVASKMAVNRNSTNDQDLKRSAANRSGSGSTSNRRASSKPNKATKPNPFDELREKVLEQVYEKIRIFASAFNANRFGRQDIKNRVPTGNRNTSTSSSSEQSTGKPSSTSGDQQQLLWSSRLPFLKPFQSTMQVAPINPDTWCGSVHTAFMQYTQLNIWLLAAFILFPVTIPLYFTGFFVLLLFRAAFCAIGWKHMVGNVVFRLSNL